MLKFKFIFNVIKIQVDVNYFFVFIWNENVGDNFIIVDNLDCYIVFVFKSKFESERRK